MGDLISQAGRKIDLSKAEAVPDVDQTHPDEALAAERPQDDDWPDPVPIDGEPRTEAVVETAIAIGATAFNILGQLAGAAWHVASETSAGRFASDVATGVRNAALKEGEPYISSAGRWSQEQLGRLVAAVTPAVMETIDVTDLAERLDLDALLARIDTDALLERIDLERLVERVNVRALLNSVDMDSLVLRVDLNPVKDGADESDQAGS